MPTPELIVLGTAQDGGLPHAGCRCAHCARARREAGFRRLPASIAVVSGSARLLVDATNAFAEQIDMLHQRGGFSELAETRYDAPGVVLVTHAHTGHYVGLWQLDRSVLAARDVRVLAPPKTAALIAGNEPWSGMVRQGFMTVESIAIDAPVELIPGVRVTAIAVPHRAEWGTDTIALRFDGPGASALYLPDIDAWDAWESQLLDMAASVDVALLDGTFWEPFPLPGVPHPPVRDTMERLQPLVDAGGVRVVFTHLNHTNPLVDPASAESREARARGFAVAREGDAFPL